MSNNSFTTAENTGGQIADQAQRDAAVAINQSFIVQAPAGSGKTELLTQRYLNLLGHVDSPENIVAITFTRKAANEMRNRIVAAIEVAKHQPRPTEAHLQRSWDFAQTVLQRDAERGWQLLDNPSRLRISTIDSLCGSLTRQMPLLSELGGGANIADNGSELYRLAARNAIEYSLGEGNSSDFALVLDYLGNNVSKLETLLADMLAKRDQWGRELATLQNSAVMIEEVEAALEQLVTAELRGINAQLDSSSREQIWALAQFAANNVLELNPQSAWHGFLQAASFPEAKAAQLQQWRLVREFLLTKGDTWRKRLDKNAGFPAGKYPEKVSMQALLASLSEDSALEAAIASIGKLPDCRFDAEQQQICQALINVMVMALTHLNLVFSAEAQVDHAEVLLRALRALGDEQEPTDLALALDYRIQHILADEVQDTSHSQFELLRKLTAGWQSGDGRTLFAVGDPMQSIYRFREADVSLYLNAWENGLAGLPLQQLQLTVNFRSQAGLVDWFNDTFQTVFPEQHQPEMGAVAYAPAVANHPPAEQAVTVHPLINSNSSREAEAVVSVVKQRLADFASQNANANTPDKSVAILVRSRSHLVDIVLELQQQGIPFAAVDVESLGEQTVVGDLRSLTRALLHPADRVAWLAVLRAPFCGLSMAQLHRVAAAVDRSSALLPLWARLQGIDDIPALQRLKPVFSAARAALAEDSLAAVVEQTWLQLGGAACIANEQEQAAVQLYLQCLAGLEQQQGCRGNLQNFAALDEALTALFAPPNSDGRQVQLMTIHKSKGLQFDTVILPGLNRQTRAEDAPPLQWLELATEHGDQMVLAPFKRDGGQHSALYNYIQEIKKQRALNERDRLLYVGVTRAEQQLHLFSVNKWPDPEKEITAPVSSSLLSPLWPSVSRQFHSVGYSEPELAEEGEVATTNHLQRLADSISIASVDNPALPPLTVPARDDPDYLQYQWQAPQYRYIGTVLHGLLEQYSQTPFKLDSKVTAAVRGQLTALGLAQQDMDWASGMVTKALRNTLNDAAGRWLLATHEDAHSEWALATAEGSLVIDRSFIADGQRWIIDYKTSRPRGSTNVYDFLVAEQQRYAQQLQRYAELFTAEPLPIRLALYFPLIPALHSWECVA